jgi:signal transduction histidine kinase/GAF domain-containing protein
MAGEIEGRVVRLDFARMSEIDDVRRAVLDAGGHEVEPSGKLLESLDGLGTPQPILIATNVDSLPHHWARRFLAEIRTRVQDKRLVVILTGEHDLEELTYGPNSEFRIDAQYVIQGFDLEEFRLVVRRYLRNFSFRFHPDADVEDRLFRLTGGNTGILQVVLTIIHEERFRAATPVDEPLLLDDLEARLASPSVSAVLEPIILRHALRLMPLCPDSWSNLERLIEKKTLSLREPPRPPGALTLSGIAVRKTDSLEFSCDLMRRAVTRYFNHRRLGDLYATAGQWETALDHYRQMDESERLRPATAYDRRATDRLALALVSRFHVSAKDGAAMVRQVFADGCRHALGFSEVVFLQRLGPAPWEPIDVAGLPPPSDSAKKAALVLLAESPRPEESEIKITAPWDGAVFGVRLAGIWSDQSCAVLIGDFERCEPVSNERRKLAAHLLRQFQEAHDHAVVFEHQEQLLRFHRESDRISQEVIEALGGQILDVDGVLKSAAKGLRSLGYRRVFFSLIDPKERFIRGAWDECEDPSFNLARHSNWRLRKPAPVVDVQQWVVLSKKPVNVVNASDHPLTNQEVVEGAGLKAFAIAPLFAAGERVIGTLHLERGDRSPLSDEEVTRFVRFGRTLAALIQHGERVHLLQSALDKIPDPLVIVDRRARIRYANNPAAELFPNVIPGRWFPALEGSGKIQFGAQNRDLIRALMGRRTSHHVEGVGSREGHRAAVLAEPLSNYCKDIVGAFLFAEDLNYTYRVLDAMARAAQAEDRETSMSRLLDAMKILGHSWGMLYLLQEGPRRLVPAKQFGFAGGSAGALEFEAGIVLEPPLGNMAESWLALNRRAPVVFCYTGNDARFETLLGLSVQGISDPKGSGVLRKGRGEYWIDVPLLAGNNPLGKLSLQCDAQLKPEHFEFLKVFTSVASLILEGFGIREESIRLQEAERALASLSHTLATKVAWLWPAVDVYDLAAANCPDVLRLNKKFRRHLSDTVEVLNRSKECLRGVVLDTQPFDLMQLLKDCIEPVSCAVLRDHAEVPVVADPLLLKNALGEILANCAKAVSGRREPRIALSIEVFQREGIDKVRISVADNGPGVPNHLKTEIFKDFVSYDLGNNPGTGLGLGLARRVVRAHRGWLSEAGVPGEGAEFIIELPRFVHAPDRARKEIHDV